MPRIVRKILTKREHQDHPAVPDPEENEPIVRGGDPDLEEDVSDDPTEIGDEAKSPVRVMIPTELKKE